MSGAVTGNFYLGTADMQTNARIIYNYLTLKGWSVNAIAGMLGNMQTESTINPAIWESLNEGNTAGGFGLVQWTPATKLIEWANAQGLDYTDIYTQLDRILWEVANGGQYYPTSNYPESFAEFTTSNKSPEYLAQAFLLNYERPADQNQPARSIQARYWYDYLIGEYGGGGGGTVTQKRKSMPLLMMYFASKRV